MNTISANGIDIAYEVSGSGPVVMFIGGIDMGIAEWNRFYVPAFREKGYQALTVSLRGISPSSVTPPPYTVETLAADCQGVLEALKIDRCYVVGASLGAFVAQEMALQHPRGKEGLALVATTVRQTAWVRMLTRAELALYDSPETLPVDYVVALDLLQLFTVTELCDDDLVTKMAGYMKSKNLAETGRRGLFSAVAGYDGCRDRLAGLTIPTIFISFADDILAPAGLVKQSVGLVPQGRYVEIGASGHFGIYGKSMEVKAAIFDHLEEVARRTQIA